MAHTNKKMILGFFVVVAMTFSMLVTPIAAAQVSINADSFERVFEADENGHTYVYVEPKHFDLISREYVTLEDDIDYERYRMENSGWSRSTGTWPDTVEVNVDWYETDGFSSGPWGESTLLPNFWDFEGEFNSTVERNTVQFPMGAETTVALESMQLYVGVIPVGGAEFVHLTIESLQDGAFFEFVIVDSEGVPITEGFVAEGDIAVMPFKPGTGTHYMWFGGFSTLPGVLMFTVKPQAVTPQNIPLGNLVTDTLTASELTLVDGSVVHTEKAPTVHTYKFRSPNGPAAISYSFNYPEILPIASPLPVGIFFTSDILFPDYGGIRFADGIGSPTTDTFFYQTTQDETYYITVMGGDNVNYALYNALVEDPDLPVNEEFLLQNPVTETAYRAFGLTVEEDSFMRVNSTVAPGTCEWYMYTVDENDFFRTFPIGYNNLIQGSSVLYMPAGEYVLWATMDGSYVGEFEFNIGPITEDLSASVTTIGGFRVPSNGVDFYNFTMLMTNEDNVTATTQYYFFDSSAELLFSSQNNLANRWDGSHWMPHPVHENFTYVDYYDYTSDDYTLIAVSPYQVTNNTDGGSNEYQNYAVNYTISFDEITEDLIEVASLSIGSGNSYTFDLPLPGLSNEVYQLKLNLTAGVWYNVSVTSDDVNSFSADLLHIIGERTHETQWSDLNDNYVGSIGTGFWFEFGAMTDNPTFMFWIGRALSTEGNLTVTIEPLLTNHLAELPSPPAPGVSLATLGTVGAVVVVAGAVIVVVYLVYTKKLKK